MRVYLRFQESKLSRQLLILHLFFLTFILEPLIGDPDAGTHTEREHHRIDGSEGIVQPAVMMNIGDKIQMYDITVNYIQAADDQ